MPFERGRYTYQNEPDDERSVDDIVDDINSGGSSGTGERLPIGVPADFTALVPRDLSGMSATAAEGWASQGAGHGTMREVGPRYFDGDEWKPATLSPTSIAELQQQMAQAGLIGSGQTFGPGAWDDVSRNAYKDLLAFANARGISAEAAILVYQSGQNVETDEQGNIVSSGVGEVPPLITRTTPASDLREVFRQAVIDTLGQGWDQSRIDQMIRAYNQVEISRQREQYEMELAGQSGNVEAIPSPEAFIIQQARKADPYGAQAEDVLDFTNEFAQAIGSPAWGVG